MARCRDDGTGKDELDHKDICQRKKDELKYLLRFAASQALGCC
jgi:hypothetical protein